MIQALEAHVQTLREDLACERADRAEERQLLRNEIQDLKTDLVTERTHARDLADRLDQAHRERQADIEARARLEMDVAGLQSELEQAHARLADLKAEGEHQAQEIDRLCTELEQARRPWWLGG